MKTVAFLGAKQIGLDCLKVLNSLQEKGDFSINAVFTNMGRNATVNKQLAKYATDQNIKVYDEIDELLTLDKFDYIISVQYHKILKKTHIACANELAINLHMAPLPEYRGCNQFSYAIIDGAKEFGTTLHVIDEGVDSGDILAELRFPIPKECYVTELYSMTVEKSVELFSNNILTILSGEYKRVPQESLVAERGTMLGYRADINKLKEIDLNWDKDKIVRHIRATSMPGFEPPYAIIDGQKFFVSKQ